MLSSPIILYDHPEVAPESDGRPVRRHRDRRDPRAARPDADRRGEGRGPRAPTPAAAAIIDRMRRHAARDVRARCTATHPRARARPPDAGCRTWPCRGGSPPSTPRSTPGPTPSWSAASRSRHGTRGAAAAVAPGRRPRHVPRRHGRHRGRRVPRRRRRACTSRSRSTTTRRPRRCSSGTAATCTSTPTRSSRCVGRAGRAPMSGACSWPGSATSSSATTASASRWPTGWRPAPVPRRRAGRRLRHPRRPPRLRAARRLRRARPRRRGAHGRARRAPSR